MGFFKNTMYSVRLPEVQDNYLIKKDLDFVLVLTVEEGL